MNPVVRELHPRGKALSVAAFAFAVVASGYGVFTTEPLEVFSVRFPPGSVSAFVFIALVVGVVAMRKSLGKERCRRCRVPLQQRRLRFPASEAERVASAVEAGDARALEGVAVADAGVVVDVRHCPQCRSVAVLQARAAGETELTSEHVVVGPSAAGWLAPR
jgi:hypothetical protein